MIWHNFHYLWFLAAIPLLIAGLWWYQKQHSKRWAAYFDLSLLQNLRLNYWPLGKRLKAISLYIGLAFLVVALAGPKIGTSVKHIKREGVNLVIALDLSASMNAEDVKPSRLKKAKYELQRLINRLKGSRVGLIVFTGDAYLQSPLTLDYSSVKLYLNNADTDLMPNSATDIGNALQVAADAFKNSSTNKQADKASNVLLIVTDGGNHGQSYSQALSSLKKQNVTVYTLGIGTKEGSPIPIYNTFGKIEGYKHNKKGKIVITKLHDTLLKKIAQKSGGEYYQIASGRQGINAFLQQISKLQKGKFASKRYTNYKNQYQLLAGIGLAFLVISLIFSNFKKNRKVTA